MSNRESFEARLKLYNKIAAGKQAAYKQSSQACQSIYIQHVYTYQACARHTEPFLTTLHHSENFEVIIERAFHMDNLT